MKTDQLTGSCQRSQLENLKGKFLIMFLIFLLSISCHVQHSRLSLAISLGNRQTLAIGTTENVCRQKG